jgi:hypothetical protein
MSLPARVWLSGFGSRLVPRAPFEVARLPEGERVVFAHHGTDGVSQVMVAPDTASTDPKTTQMKLGRNTRAASDALSFIEVDEFSPAWRLVTRDYSCAWPHGWTLWSTPYKMSWHFELSPSTSSVRDQMMYVQGPWSPARAPELAALIGGGMRESNRGELTFAASRCAWLELHYSHDGQLWAQRRYRIEIGAGAIMLLTAQAPGESPDVGAAEELAGSLQMRVST